MTACDCSTEWYDGPAVSRTEIRTARKRHVCCECGHTIEPGERYEHVSGVWDGSWSTFKTCDPCRRIRLDFCSGGWEYGNLRGQIMDCLGFDYVSGKGDDEEDEA